jgi:hypothetical protein
LGGKELLNMGHERGLRCGTEFKIVEIEFCRNVEKRYFGNQRQDKMLPRRLNTTP